jgi:hypothetical protein
MRLIINGVEREFTPIKAFREQYQLPQHFGIHLFEPKDYTGLGTIEHAGSEMVKMRDAIVRDAARPRSLAEWMRYALDLTDLFRRQLQLINDVVQLKDVEIDFAAAGLSDVLQAIIYAIIRARAAQQTPPTFASIYNTWLNSTVKISQMTHFYPYAANVSWEIHIVTHVYGRAGLIVRTADSTHYIYDPSLGCPAEGYMESLLSEIAAYIYASP